MIQPVLKVKHIVFEEYEDFEEWQDVHKLRIFTINHRMKRVVERRVSLLKKICDVEYDIVVCYTEDKDEQYDINAQRNPE